MELIDAAYNGDEVKVKQLLEAGAVVDTVNETGYTALHWATSQHHIKVVEALLEKGADVNKATQDGRTAVHFAAVKPQASYGYTQDAATPKDQDSGDDAQLALLQLLLSKKPDLSLTNVTGRTALHLAAGGGSTAQVEALLHGGADIEAADIDGMTPLLVAVSESRAENVKILILSGATINVKDEDNRTALQIAASLGNGEVMSVLVDAGADIKVKDQDGGSVLHLAAKSGQLKLVEQLLRRGAAIDDKDEDDMTPLHLAAEFGQDEVVKLLLKKGADLAATDAGGQTPLHRAVAKQHTDVVKAVLKAGADVKTKDLAGCTPLHLAATTGHSQDMQLLLEAGAELNAKDENECTPLHLAVSNNCKEAVQKLLELGADVNAVEEDGATALHLASQQNRLALVDMLLATNNVDLNAKDKEGRTAASIAFAKENIPLVVKLTAAGVMLDAAKGEVEKLDARKDVEELRQQMAKCGPGEQFQAPVVYEVTARKSSSSSNPLHNAAKVGNVKQLGLMISRFNLMDKDYKGRTPLHLAAANGFGEAVKFILQRNDDPGFVNMLNDDYKTAMEMAMENKHMDVVGLLRAYGAKMPNEVHTHNSGGFFGNLFGTTREEEREKEHEREERRRANDPTAKPRLRRNIDGNASSSYENTQMFGSSSDSRTRRDASSMFGSSHTRDSHTNRTTEHEREVRSGGHAIRFRGPDEPAPPTFGINADVIQEYAREPVFVDGFLKVNSLGRDLKTSLEEVNRLVRKVGSLGQIISTDGHFVDMCICVKNTRAVLYGLLINPGSIEMMSHDLHFQLKPTTEMFEKLERLMEKRSTTDETKYTVFGYSYPLLETALRMGLALSDYHDGRGGFFFGSPESACRSKLLDLEPVFMERVERMRNSSTIRRLSHRW